MNTVVDVFVVVIISSYPYQNAKQNSEIYTEFFLGEILHRSAFSVSVTRCTLYEGFPKRGANLVFKEKVIFFSK